MNISQAAARSGVPAKTIRYYESIGLIRQAGRTDSGYRVYTDRDVETLRFIQRSRSLGFSVGEVEDLLALWLDRDRASSDVRRMAEEHVREIERKIAELQGMRGTLRHLIDRCHGDDRPECPILEELAGDEATAAQAAELCH
jgi:Cu(I)-responsive transcriptional regulator